MCDQLARDEYDFFPKDRALCLEYVEEQGAEKLEMLEDRLNLLVERMKQLVGKGGECLRDSSKGKSEDERLAQPCLQDLNILLQNLGEWKLIN